jgi:hypothetical protein
VSSGSGSSVTSRFGKAETPALFFLSKLLRSTSAISSISFCCNWLLDIFFVVSLAGSGVVDNDRIGAVGGTVGAVGGLFGKPLLTEDIAVGTGRVDADGRGCNGVGRGGNAVAAVGCGCGCNLGDATADGDGDGGVNWGV